MNIALSGKACVGKSAIAKILHDHHGYSICTFAEPIYAAVNISKAYLAGEIGPFNMAEFLEALTDREAALRFLPEWFNIISRNTEVLLSDVKARGFMQQWGSTLKLIDEAVFIRAMLDSAEGDRNVCDDLRTVEEAWAMRDAGWLLVRLECSEEEMKRRVWKLYPTSYHLLHHHIETDLDTWESWDAVVCTDGPKNEMPEKVQALLNQLAMF